MILPILLGIGSAIAFVALVRRWMAEHARVVFSLSLILAALIYVVAAVVAGEDLLRQLVGLGAYGLLGIAGLRGSWRAISFGWLAHGLWDLLGHPGDGALLPEWYPWLCGAFDVVLAVACSLLPPAKTKGA